MKKIASLLTVAAALLVSAISSPAQVVITALPVTETTQLPGSAMDYTIFGNGSQFPALTNYGGTNNGIDSGVQTDFTVAPLVTETASPNGGGSVINNPAGNSVQTGVIFGRTANANESIVSLTLGTGSTTFNYGDFNLYVMVGNAPGDGNLRDSAISLTDGSTVLALPVTDTNSSFTNATFLEFNVIGASAGDTLVLGATSANLPYLGGVSLESVGAVPEPSTYAMILGGMAVLGLVGYRSRRLSA